MSFGKVLHKRNFMRTQTLKKLEETLGVATKILKGQTKYLGTRGGTFLWLPPQKSTSKTTNISSSQVRSHNKCHGKVGFWRIFAHLYAF